MQVSVRLDIEATITMLIDGQVLPANYFDHQLQGDFKEYRECHIRDDLLLMYRKDEKAQIIVLSDIGSHTQLFG